MKKGLLSCLAIIIFQFAIAQLGDVIKRKAGEGAKQGAQTGTEKAIDKGINKIFSKKEKKKNAGNDDPVPENSTPGQTTGSTTGAKGSTSSIKTYSKYDFIPGEKILAYDDFSQDAVGDFPAKWATNASGEIMTVDQYAGKWLNVSKQGFFIPQFIKSLPDNFTMEFDLLFMPSLPERLGPNTASLGLQLINNPGTRPNFDYAPDRAYFELDPYLGNVGIASYAKSGEKILSNEFSVKGIDRNKLFFYHVAVWRQKTRLRVYLNETKVVDVPSLMPADIKYNSIRFATSLNNDGSTWLISNFKYASGLPDARNKLITEGKFSTTGILFDVNAASIKAASYGTLKDIATVLKENPAVNVKIVGHTDSDGDNAANLDLSKKRAEAVKDILAKEFSIDDSRMQTEGRGKPSPLCPIQLQKERLRTAGWNSSNYNLTGMEKKLFALLIILLFTRHLPVSGQNEKDAYEILVYNSSKFDIRCVPQCEKNEGDFAASTSYLKAGQIFLFRVQKSAGGILPRGVEGTITFSTLDPKYTGASTIHFNNPAVGSAEFDIGSSDWPIMIVPMTSTEIGKLYSGYFKEPVSHVKIIVDTARDKIGKINPPVLTGNSSSGGNGQPSSGMLEPIPAVINFEWKVDQRMRKDDDDDDNNGKAYKTNTYLFTTNGDYAAIKPDDASFDLMIYSKKGYTWMIDDKKKTITVMNMPRTIGEGAVMGKEVAESIKKSPLEKDRDDEKFIITKTGKTKQFLGYTADEYEMKNTTVPATKSTSKTGTASFWYAKVPFDPVKVYTMGVGRPADMSKLQNDPRMKNNITAIPMLNKNYLWVETEVGGLKGMEVTNIQRVNTTIYTSGYTVKNMKSLKDMMKNRDN